MGRLLDGLPLAKKHIDVLDTDGIGHRRSDRSVPAAGR